MNEPTKGYVERTLRLGGEALTQMRNEEIRIKHCDEQKKYRLAHPEKVKEIEKKYRSTHRDIQHKSKKRWRKDYPEKFSAQQVVYRAVRDGKIIKPGTCQLCGAECVVIEGHHFDYSRPLDVVWLCHYCHISIFHGSKP
jgi:hypothetical protein